MLLQIENSTPEAINKLLSFAKENKIQLSLLDDETDNYALPGKPLSNQQLNRLINESRNSGIISMKDAHQLIQQSYDAG